MISLLSIVLIKFTCKFWTYEALWKKTADFLFCVILEIQQKVYIELFSVKTLHFVKAGCTTIVFWGKILKDMDSHDSYV